MEAGEGAARAGGRLTSPGAPVAVLLAVVAVAGLVSFGRTLHAMATTSLWTDELWSVLHYSGKGPWTVVTEYHEPNNHVFFNLLNALTPGRGSVAPLRARLWSFAAVTALLAAFPLYFARRRALAWGIVPFFVFAAGPDFLDLTLQARGYGLVALLALAASMLAVEHVRSGTPRTLALLGAVSVLGAWTVPTFVFFAVPLWGFLWLAVRGRRVLGAALATGAGIVAVHAPVAAQLLDQLAHFDESWGREYKSLGALKETVLPYLLHPTVVGATLGRWGLVALAAGLVLLVGAAWRRERDRAETKGISVVLGAAAAFLLICRILETPVIRSTVFVVVPIAFAATLAASLLPFPGGSRLRRAAAVLALSFLAFRGFSAARSFSFTPIESWMETAALVEETFPEGTPLFVTKERQYLNAYLKAEERLATAIETGPFQSGEELVLDTPIVDPPEGRVDGRKVAPCAVEYRLPQRRVRYQALWFCQPPSAFVVAARSNGGGPDPAGAVIDHDLSTGASLPAGKDRAGGALDLQLAPGLRYRSLVIVAGEASPGDLAVSAWDAAGRALPVGRTRRWERVTLVALGDREVARVAIGPAVGQGAPVVLQEVWANPTRPGLRE